MKLSVSNILGGSALCLALLASACGKRLHTANTRSDDDPAAAAIEVDAELVTDTAGVATYNWRLNSPNSQIVRASAQSSVAGSYAVFPPAAFELDSEIRIEAGATIASQKKLNALGIDKNTKIVAAGPAVVISWTYDDESYTPYKLAVPAPTAVSLEGEAPKLAVLFIRNVPQADEFILGIISGTNVASEGATAAVQVKGSGIYQAVHLSADVPDTGEVGSDEPIETIGGPAVAPGPFAVAGPTVEFSSAKPVVSWTSSKSANYFEVSLDIDDKDCKDPAKVYTPVFANEFTVDALKSGTHFVCVTAVSAAGKTEANNNGFSFVADKSPPAKPAKPTHDGPTVDGVGVEFRWAAVEDVGPSGLSHYYVEIGTTAGGSDMFTGVVADELSKTIIGFDGKTYYARVKAVDNAGNESDWSANSSPVTVDSN